MTALSSIAASGLSAAQTRLQVSASNIAQQGMEPRQRLQVQQSPQAGAGVSTQVTRAPDASAPLESDVVAQLEAKHAFLANLAVFKTANALSGALLDEQA